MTMRRKRLTNRQKGKLRKTISIDRSDYDYVDSEIQTGRFDSLSHAVRLGLICIRTKEEVTRTIQAQLQDLLDAQDKLGKRIEQIETRLNRH